MDQRIDIPKSLGLTIHLHFADCALTDIYFRFHAICKQLLSPRNDGRKLNKCDRRASTALCGNKSMTASMEKSNQLNFVPSHEIHKDNNLIVGRSKNKHDLQGVSK